MNPAHFPTIEPLESRIAPAILIVTNTNDSGPGSLRQALGTADTTTHTAPDTIVFHLPATANQFTPNVIDLQSQLLSNGNVIIAGPGAGKLIINATAAMNRAFFFNDNVDTKDSPVTVTGLAITGGDINAGGGAIYSTDSLTLKNVVISGNTAFNGAGVEVTGNTSTVPIKAAIIGSVITNNTAANYGGGLYLNQLSAATITSSIISGNKATSFKGGGIDATITMPGAGLTIANTQIAGNTAAKGSAAFLSDTAPKPSRILITGSTISGNTATSNTNFAGGVYLKTGNAIIAASQITGNSAAGAGAGIEAYHFTSLKISGSTISGNSDTDGSTTVEGAAGIYALGNGLAPFDPVTISGSTIADNSAVNGSGGIFAQFGVALSITGSKFINNRGIVAGGIQTLGAGQLGVSLSLVNSIVSGNSAENQAGGIDVLSDGPVSLIASKIVNNVTESFGGGARLNEAAALTIRNTIVSGNVAGTNGGGLFIYGTTGFKIIGGSITGNSAAGNGGGLYSRHASGTISGTTISGDSAITKGGGIYNSPFASSDKITLSAARITGNIAPAGPNLYGNYITGT